MSVQTFEDMRSVHGASFIEARLAAAVWELLEPCLKIQSDGRVMTAGGDKTKLGLLRSIVRVMAENEKSSQPFEDFERALRNW